MGRWLGLALLVGCGGATQQQQGSVGALPDTTLAGRHADSIVELLRGRVPGLEVIQRSNGDISLRIRGGDPSLLGEGAGPREPLLVVDGMPVASNNVSRVLNSLRPHEVDDIQVLKDVASTSVYGTRGAHGVILITTKRR